MRSATACLEIHEAPAMRQKSPCILRKGMVVTVEPGLYYHGLGGCPIEDMVHPLRFP